MTSRKRADSDRVNDQSIPGPVFGVRRVGIPAKFDGDGRLVSPRFIDQEPYVFDQPPMEKIDTNLWAVVEQARQVGRRVGASVIEVEQASCATRFRVKLRV